MFWPAIRFWCDFFRDPQNGSTTLSECRSRLKSMLTCEKVYLWNIKHHYVIMQIVKYRSEIRLRLISFFFNITQFKHHVLPLDLYLKTYDKKMTYRPKKIICLSVVHFVFPLFQHFFLSIFCSVFLSFCLSVSLSLCLSVSLSLCLSVSLPLIKIIPYILLNSLWKFIDSIHRKLINKIFFKLFPPLNLLQSFRQWCDEVARQKESGRNVRKSQFGFAEAMNDCRYSIGHFVAYKCLVSGTKSNDIR